MSKVNLIIQFKPEFELKLKRLRIKGKFLNEMRRYITRRCIAEKEYGIMHIHLFPGLNVDPKTHRNVDSAIYLNKLKHWRQFIQCAFNLEETTDGYQYWNEIAKK